ncbi:MAG TPA: hypothetical protein VOA19_07855 [Actinomycetes bacterium]|nr:hypothetical protein [Actinomycetes bacterium]
MAAESGWAAVEMTQQYLAGELSLRLARLQAVATNQASVREVAHLRREVEAGPLTALTSVVMRALALTDSLCWDSLDRGNAAVFSQQATISAELCEFGVCAGLLEERPPYSA